MGNVHPDLFNEFVTLGEGGYEGVIIDVPEIHQQASDVNKEKVH